MREVQKSGPLILDIAGVQLTEEDKSLIANPCVGGVILFSRNYENKNQLKDLIHEIKVIDSQCLICVDHEGGRVQRFRDDFTPIPAMQTLGELFKRNPEIALSMASDLAWVMAAELLDCGVDLSFAPVLDVDDNYSSIIGDRAFSPEPEVVTKIGDAFIEGMHDAGMCATGKHFPGHGSVVADSHLELPIDKRSLKEVEAKDMVPFKSLLTRMEGLMPAHIVFEQIDPLPVGFSPFWIKTYLRKQLGYQGIIFSDDLTMEGATGAGNYSERANAAMRAGCDVILVCNNRAGAIEVMEYLAESEWQDFDSRLYSLLMKKSGSKEELERHPRWQRVQEFISSPKEWSN